MDNLNLLLTPSQVAQALGLSYRQVKRLIENGTLPTKSSGNNCRIALQDIVAVHPMAVDTLLITTGQAAEILGVSNKEVLRMVGEGELDVVQLNVHHRFFLNDVLDSKNGG
jgi:excisionase family DNA binding protein